MASGLTKMYSIICEFRFFFLPLQAESQRTMVVTFNEGYLESLYTKGETGIKKLRFQPQIVRGYQKAVKYLIQARRKEDLFPFKSLHFEALHGDSYAKHKSYSRKPAGKQYGIIHADTSWRDDKG